MEKTGWKTMAIIFIIFTILMFALFIWMFWIGTSVINNENECSVMCSNLDLAVSYWYDNYDNICYCSDANGENVKTIYIE